jgi:HSP20 family protein
VDQEKLKQWMELAKNIQGGDFWNNIFDQDFAKQFVNDQTTYSNLSNSERQPDKKENNSRPFPVIDVIEGDEEVIVCMELPGIMKENIELALSGNILTVKGNILPSHPHLKISYSERLYGEFKRQITLPDVISPNQLSAKFWNGLLFVSYQRIVEKGEIIPID